MIEHHIKEVVDRCRRMETRLTKFLEHQGFDTKVRRPTWDNGSVVVPSISTSLSDCINTVPPGWDPAIEIDVICKDSVVLTFFLPEK